MLSLRFHDKVNLNFPFYENSLPKSFIFQIYFVCNKRQKYFILKNYKLLFSEKKLSIYTKYQAQYVCIKYNVFK